MVTREYCEALGVDLEDTRQASLVRALCAYVTRDVYSELRACELEDEH